MGTVLEAARTVEGVREIVQILVDGNIDKGQAIRWITDALKDYDLGGPMGDSRWLMVPREKLQQVASTLAHKLGDTDPYIDEDATDEDVRDEEPVFWACQQINVMLGAAPVSEPAASGDTHAFQNFHRSLCERFGYTHDPIDWRRDQVSLIEHIAAKVPAADAASGEGLEEFRNELTAMATKVNVLDRLARVDAILSKVRRLTTTGGAQ